jgi:outer membrane protein OmpA-like peptidoglycan-associated protein
MKFFYALVFAGIICVPSYSQQAAFPEGYYVIVGAFSIKKNAERFNAALNNKQVKSAYGYLPSRKLYYVYTLNDDDASKCIEAAKELRKEAQFSDAWVRYIGEKVDSRSMVTPTEEKAEAGTRLDNPTASSVVENKTQLSAAPEAKKPEESSLIEVTDNDPIVQPEIITLGNTEVFLSLYNARTDKVAQGQVQVVDTERGRLIKKVDGNTYLILPDPKSSSGKLSLICEVFGYRKIQEEIDFNNPLADTTVVEHMGTTLVVNFDLVRLQKGDIQTLFNIYFFNDAAVMMPESRFEVNSLLDMMNENPSYRIRLHGHTNGNYHGKIIKRGATGDFFSVKKDAETSVGSAKELSESRAETIHDYLVANGVDASRVEIKAWGGKRPIYDKHSANAKKNIRVEVEIISQ